MENGGNINIFGKMWVLTPPHGVDPLVLVGVCLPRNRNQNPSQMA